MDGGHLGNFKKLFRLNLVLVLVLNGITILALCYFLFEISSLSEQVVLLICAAGIVTLAFVSGFMMTKVLTKPTEALAQAIYHISPNEHLVAAPDVDKLNFGRELVATLTRQMYDMASTHKAISENEPSSHKSRLLDNLPLGILGLDAKGEVKFVNLTAKQAFGLPELNGETLDQLLSLKFPDEDLKQWMSQAKNKSINATTTWSHVEIGNASSEERSYYDVSASYYQKNNTGIEVILALFPRHELYENEQDTVNLLSMSVHEIRTPLTILRGYIEVLRQELSGKVDQATQQYIDRISTSSENLASYMANVLNVAKAEQNELKLDLRKTDWSKELYQTAQLLSSRANVRGKQIILSIQPKLPEVAADTLSINEVVTNLVENSIKYSPPEAKNIYIDSSIDSNGSVLTTIRDEGVGIPDSLIKNLFTKFYRDHRNKVRVSGTGLGLYISKEIVNAHHGNIWIKSKEGEGTTVGFTLIPATKLEETLKNADNGFEKVGKGWIKNHNMQRR